MDNTRPTPRHGSLLSFAGVMVVLLISGPTLGQMRDSDPRAAEAFAEVITQLRKAPRTVEEIVVVTTREGDIEESAPQRMLRWAFVPGRGLKAEFDGFRIRLADGRMQAVHESREDLVVDLEDRGSPYYALFTQFRDLPWPGLAMAIGESKPEDCAMQLNSRAPWLQPTGLVLAEEDHEGKGRRIEFSSDIERMWLDIDAKSGLPKEAEVVIHGGPFVPDGVEIAFRYRWNFGTVEDPKAVLALPIDGRERVEAVGGLERRPEGVAQEPGGGDMLPGRKAPLFDLPGLDPDSDEISLLGLRGRVLVLDFWATWCGPCRAALPRMAEVGRWARDNGIPVEVLAINTSEQSRTLELRRRRISSFLEDQGMDLDGLAVVLDLDGSVADAFAVRGLPTTVVIDAAGQVVTVKTGFGPGSEERLKQDLLDLFEGGDPEPSEEDGLT